MKTRFSTLDICASLKEINEYLVGHYVVNIYDIDNKTYLIKLRTQNAKKILLLESGARIHPTEMEWPKSNAPSGFSMKMRKHLKGKRLVAATQLGFDRIIDLQFGNRDEFAFHLVIELYDRGNVVLTDCDYNILNLLRQRTDKTTEERYAVNEIYPLNSATELKLPFASVEEIKCEIERQNNYSNSAGGKKKKKTLSLGKVLNSTLGYGNDVIDHFLYEHQDLNQTSQKTDFSDEQYNMILDVITKSYQFLLDPSTKYGGYIRIDEVESPNGGNVISFVDYQPFKFNHLIGSVNEFERFSFAVDAYFGAIQTQKSEQKMLQAEKAAIKKLENVKLDHQKRLENLQRAQNDNKVIGQLIEMNLELVETAIGQVRSAIASQIDWGEISEFLEEAQQEGDPVASAIKDLKLKTNQIVMFLSEPNYEFDSDSDDNESEPPMTARVTINLELSAYGNAKSYYDSKKEATKKEMKTIDASKKALKAAEKKTMDSLKDIEIVKQISKARKTLWFEKFIWFISSENYLVIAGRDAQQNEIMVKKHLKPGDVYVHADIHGASSCVVKNPRPEEPISPVTLHEVGHAAVCYSAAWDAKVVTSAWWVHSNQVSKTAPSGEYLTTGSFMIRGKKNFLPPSHLIMGIGFLFKLDETSILNHTNERKIKGAANEIIAGDKTDKSEERQKITNEMEDKVSSNSEDEDDPFESDIKIDYKIENALPDEEVIYLGDDKPIIVKYSKHDEKNNKESKQQHIKKERAKPAWKLEKEAKQAEQRQKRGKAGKLKKIKEKYADQDEEDRLAAMELLHGKSGKSKKEKRQSKKEQKPERKVGNNRGQSKKKEVKTGNVFQRANEELPPPQEISATDLTKTNINSTENAADHEQESDDEDVNKLLEEEGFGDNSNLLDTLTGKPLADDIIHYAIPVIAPFPSVRDYKYHIKMTPGTGKKGKTSKQAIQLFCALKDAMERETLLIKASKEEEITRNMPGKVKLSAANLNQIKGKKKS